MRSALLAGLALLSSTPAVAAGASSTTREAEAMARTLNDPATQRAMSGALGAMVSALLDMRIDGVAKALEPLNGGKPVMRDGKTVRDLAARDDPRFEQKLETGTRTAVAGMGAMATAMATMLPELERAMERLGDAAEQAQRRMPATAD